MTDFAGKVAIVTGASQGIGQAVAIDLAARGASVVVNVPNQETSAEETLRGMNGAPSLVVAADVSQTIEVEAMMAAVRERFGHIDILVNNAGIYLRSIAIETPEEVFDRTIAVNLKGSWLCAKAVIPGMIAQGWGRIINLSSSAGFRGAPGGAHYAATKAGLVGLTKSLALEVAAYGITVNAVAPGITDTAQPRGALSATEFDTRVAQIPNGRITTPDDVARLIAYLVGPDSGAVTGQTIHINGGELLP